MGGSNPSYLAGHLRRAGLPSCWKVGPSARGAACRKNYGRSWTWVVTGSLSTRWTYNLVNDCKSLVSSSQRPVLLSRCRAAFSGLTLVMTRSPGCIVWPILL
jgi:hypothetical protein